MDPSSPAPALRHRARPAPVTSPWPISSSHTPGTHAPGSRIGAMTGPFLREGLRNALISDTRKSFCSVATQDAVSPFNRMFRPRPID